MYYVIYEEGFKGIYDICEDYMEACEKVEDMLEFFTSDIEYDNYIEEYELADLKNTFSKEELEPYFTEEDFKSIVDI